MINPQTIDDIVLPEGYNNYYPFGIPELDYVFGNYETLDETLVGLKIPCAVTVSASKGSGKTRMFLKLCDIFTQIHGPDTAIYFTNEMDTFQIKSYCDQMNASGFLVEETDNVAKIEHIIKLNKILSVDEDAHKKIKFVVIDSFDGLDFGKGMNVKEKCKFFKQFVSDHNVCVILLCQQTKSGGSAGSNSLFHAVDVNLRIDRGDEDFYGNKKVRIISCEGKNRNAQEFGSCAYQMGNGSFLFNNPLPIPDKNQSEEEMVKTNRAAQKREKLLDSILEIMSKAPYQGLLSVTDLPAIAVQLDNIGNDIPKLERHLKMLESMGKIQIVGRAKDKIWRKL